ncbi:MAG: NADAR family protein [Rubrivivax sp.]
MTMEEPRRDGTEIYLHDHGLDQEADALSDSTCYSLMWSGHRFPTSVHAYHWAKFLDPTLREWVRKATTPREAVELAAFYRSEWRPDWERQKVGVMRQLLRAKLQQHEHVRCALLGTGNRLLIHEAPDDEFWGSGASGRGRNMLGLLWMELRAELRGSVGVPPRRDLAIPKRPLVITFPITPLPASLERALSTTSSST